MNEQQAQRVVDTRVWLEREVLFHLYGHNGIENAIGMGELFEAVFEKQWEHRINDTRPLRDVIESLRDQGHIICSTRSCTGGGYFSPVGNEAREYLDKLRAEAIRKLRRIARMENIGLPDLLGQMRLNLQKNEEE